MNDIYIGAFLYDHDILDGGIDFLCIYFSSGQGRFMGRLFKALAKLAKIIEKVHSLFTVSLKSDEKV
jgi:hypothetical protein